MTIQAQQPALSIGLPIASITGDTGPFMGIFRLAELSLVPRGTRPPYHHIQLVDSSGTLVGYGWDKSFRLNGRPAFLDIVEVSVLPASLAAGSLLIYTLSACPQRLSTTRQAPLLLPVNLCPMPSLIPRLLSAINQINDANLKRFVNRMLGDKEIAEPFMKLRGSSHHHHAFPAGLLLHSIEVVEIALSIAEPGHADARHLYRRRPVPRHWQDPDAEHRGLIVARVPRQPRASDPFDLQKGTGRVGIGVARWRLHVDARVDGEEDALRL